MANKHLSSYTPPLEEILNEKRNLVDRALQFGLAKPDAEELAALACKGMSWISKKFRAFLSQYTPEDVFEEADDLFPMPVPEAMKPSKATFESALRKIYDSRSALAHQGQPYAASVALGTGDGYPFRALRDVLSGQSDIPPVTWFEKVVNFALNRYLEVC
jgi:hypothetical protein